MNTNENNVHNVATTLSCDYQGFMQKRDNNGLNFYRQYFVLKGNLLFCFERRGDSEPKGVLILEDCSILPAIDCYVQHPFCITIIFDTICKSRPYILSLDGMASLQVWLNKLRCASIEDKDRLIVGLQGKLSAYEKNMAKYELKGPTAPMLLPHAQSTDLQVNGHVLAQIDKNASQNELIPYTQAPITMDQSVQVAEPIVSGVTGIYDASLNEQTFLKPMPNIDASNRSESLPFVNEVGAKEDFYSKLLQTGHYGMKFSGDY